MSGWMWVINLLVGCVGLGLLLFGVTYSKESRRRGESFDAGGAGGPLDLLFIAANLLPWWAAKGIYILAGTLILAAAFILNG